MSFLGKLIAAKATAKIVEKLNAKSRATPVPGQPMPRQEYIPAGQAGVPARGGNAIVNKATDFYRQNPKLVAGMGVVVAAAVLQQLTRKRGLY